VGTPSPFHFGFYYHEDTDQADKNEPQDYDGERHILLFGVNGAGKSTRVLIENLVSICDRSLVVFDMKGELVAQTHRATSHAGSTHFHGPLKRHQKRKELRTVLESLELSVSMARLCGPLC
jgi:hypothetical protein